MLTEKQLDRYADVLLWGLETARTGGTKPNDLVLIRYDLPAVRLAEILQAKLYRMKRNVVLRATYTPEMEKNLYTLCDDTQLTFRMPGDDALYKALNGSIFLHAPASITHLSDVDPKRIGRAAIARKYLKDILDRRDEAGDFSWTLCIVPTEALAEHAGLDSAAYTHQVVKACFLGASDPLERWRGIYDKAQTIKKWLNSLAVKHFHIESAGTDLEITPGENRRWIGISGHNIPSFELFLSPDWRGTRGYYYADQPSFRSGNYVKGLRLEFKNGRALQIRAEAGEIFARRQLEMDPGANRIGEFSLTDKRFSRIDRFMANTLYDENYGGKFGNCHIALGSSYSDTFAGNPATLTKGMKKKLGFNDSALHWDVVNTEKKRVSAHLKTGETLTIYENGLFSI
ncbi:MAG: aminopeptidase [Thermodesulfobacteriota bacterium]